MELKVLFAPEEPSIYGTRDRNSYMAISNGSTSCYFGNLKFH
jgi:hypothetical protein